LARHPIGTGAVLKLAAEPLVVACFIAAQRQLVLRARCGSNKKKTQFQVKSSLLSKKATEEKVNYRQLAFWGRRAFWERKRKEKKRKEKRHTGDPADRT
jgi:hypothetical protein